MRISPAAPVAVACAAVMSACSSSGATVGSPMPQSSTAPAQVPSFTPSGPSSSPTSSPSPASSPTAQPQVVHVGFQHLTTTDPTYGQVSFYSPATGNAAVVRVVKNSQVVFSNDGSGSPHTASGFGSTGFPATFDNVSGTTASGTTIDNGMTWSTGSLNPGQTSSAFTVPAGTYYFGCAYHYNSNAMRDVIVSS